jgi:predicted GTPase
VEQVERNVRKVNPKAEILRANLMITLDVDTDIKGKNVLIVEDGPTLTHGEMGYGAATIKAKELDANIVDPRPFAKGSIKEIFELYPHLGNVLPAIGYSKNQIKELNDTINSIPCDLVLLGTPIDLRRFMDVDKPILRVRYEFEELEKKSLLKKIIQVLS